MDLFGYLSSINKISILAFIATLGYLIYEVRLLKKEKQKNVKPIIPQFDQAATPIPIETQQIVTDEIASKKSNYHKIMLTVLIVMLGFFGLTTILGFINAGKEKDNTAAKSQVVVQEVRSQGIKVYDSKWAEFKDDTVTAINPGDILYIGVSNIRGTDVDKARIRVNKGQWTPETITEKYDQPHNVYYVEHTVGTGEAQLQIEAQLHSKTDGWLSE